MTRRPAIIELDTVDSTMTEAADRWQRGGIGMWSAVVARLQTAGRGRADREWTADRDTALLTTVIACTSLLPQRFGLLSLAAGLAVVDEIEALGVTVGLKWPNDVMMDDRKLGGILIRTTGDDPATVFVGVGLNLSATPDAPTVNAAALSDAGLTPPPAPLLAERIAARVRTRFAQVDDDDGAQTRREWMAKSIWLGEMVELRTPDAITGTIGGIDQIGQLILDVDGEERRFAVGDVHRGPRKSPPLYT